MKQKLTAIYQFYRYYANLPFKERGKQCSMSWNEIYEMLNNESPRGDISLAWSVIMELRDFADKIDAGGNDDVIVKLIQGYKK